MHTNELQQIEVNIKQAQKTVDLGEAFERLSVNRDFKKVITEGYFEQEAIRLVHLLSDPSMQTTEVKKSIETQMFSIGALKHYFQVLKFRASIAQKAIAADEETRDELLSEELR